MTSCDLQANQPFRILAHGVIECVAGVHFLLEVVGELLGHFRIVTGELLVAVFGVDVFCDRDRRLLGVEDKRSLSLGGESRAGCNGAVSSNRNPQPSSGVPAGC